jgi:hypothetical protein
MVHSSLPAQTYFECVEYDQKRIEARANNGPPVGPPPAGYYQFLMDAEYGVTDHHPRQPITPANDDYVRMPADTLNMIVRAIGQNKPASTPPTFPRAHQTFNPANRFHPRPRFNPPPPQRGNFNRGRGSNNRRPKKNHAKPQDPRRRFINNNNRAGPSRLPDPITIDIQDHVADAPTEGSVADDLSFLSDFVNTDLSAFAEEMVDSGSPMETGPIAL